MTNCSNHHQSSYRVLDLDILLDSDSKELTNLFDRDYGWFRVPKVNGNHRLNFSIQLNDPKDIFVRSTNIQSSIVNIQSLKGHPNPVSCAHQTILRHLFNAFDDFVFLHAGVVAGDNRAVILAGPPGVGKTALVLRLLEEGFIFLSDDFCPVHKESGLVHPFPRSVWVANGEGEIGDGRSKRGKTLVTPVQLGAKVGDTPCRSACIICLDPGEGSPGFCELEIGLKEEYETEFIRDLRKLDGVSLSRLDTPFSEWRITYPNRSNLTGEVREYLKRHEHQIWNVYRNDRVQPDFKRAPVLSPISTHEAVFYLLQDLKQDPVFGRGEDATNDLPGRFFVELNDRLKGIPCYRLRVGRLEEMSGLIRGLVKC